MTDLDCHPGKFLSEGFKWIINISQEFIGGPEITFYKDQRRNIPTCHLGPDKFLCYFNYTFKQY